MAGESAGWEVAREPGRAKDNSPSIYRWVRRAAGSKSRQGRKKARRLPGDFFRPSGASIGLLGAYPSDESLGYCRSSLTGLAKGLHSERINTYAQAVIRTVPTVGRQRV